MSIETVNSIQNVLSNYKAKDWTKAAELELGGKLNFNMNEQLGAPERQSFSEMLSSSISEVNGLQQEANKAIERLVTGKSKNIHETLLAVERADIAFKTMNQIRMKVIDAYKEVMRMQV